MTTTLLHGDCRAILPTLPAASVQCVVTSPPYFGLRDYGVDGQIGQEQTLAEYIQTMVAVFHEVWRVLKDDGTCWINLGDSYARNPSRGIKFQSGKSTYLTNRQAVEENRGKSPPPGLKEKNLLGVPWRVAFALQDEGWILRTDCIWSKPNAMPDSVQDRPTRSHEYLFLFAKQSKYYYNADAIAEPAINENGGRAGARNYRVGPTGDKRIKTDKQGELGNRRYTGFNGRWDGRVKAGQSEQPRPTRNKRTVWTIPVHSTPDAHFATFPEKLVEPCILAGSRPGDTVLDPFMGSGTVARVATRLQRHSIGVELNEQYIELQRKRTNGVQIAMIEVL